MVHFLAFMADTAQDAAHGAGTHASGPMTFEWVSFVSSIIVFLVALLILWKTVWPKITAALDERDLKIRSEIEAAEEAREQAKRALAQYEAELGKAREEANRMIRQAREDARATGDELRKRNEVELAELRTRAQRDIHSAKEAAIREIHAEVATLATAVASRILQREITVQDQQRLVEESLDQLSAVRN